VPHGLWSKATTLKVHCNTVANLYVNKSQIQCSSYQVIESHQKFWTKLYRLVLMISLWTF